MRYLLSYRFIFHSPKWGMNLLLTSVCSLIPIVGQIVLIGYFFEIIDVFLLRRGRLRKSTAASSENVMDALPPRADFDAASYPEFDFGRFTEYLTRGVWPFLVYFIVYMVVGFLMTFVLMFGFMIAAIITSKTGSPWPMVFVYGLFWMIYMALIAIVGIVITPLYLRAGLSGDFAGAFSAAFFRDFMKRVGKETVLVQLFIALTGVGLTLGGFLLCFIGVYPAMMLLQYAHHHLEYQLYELYLERGGEPVERLHKGTLDREADIGEERSDLVMPPPHPERSTDVMREEGEW